MRELFAIGDEIAAVRLHRRIRKSSDDSFVDTGSFVDIGLVDMSLAGGALSFCNKDPE